MTAIECFRTDAQAAVIWSLNHGSGDAWSARLIGPALSFCDGLPSTNGGIFGIGSIRHIRSTAPLRFKHVETSSDFGREVHGRGTIVFCAALSDALLFLPLPYGIDAGR